MGSNARPHAVLIPYPAQGHVIPLLQLAKVLHSRGFVITYVNTEYNHRRLLRSRGADSLDGLDDFRFETIPDGLPPSSNDDVTQDIPTLCESLLRNGASSFRDLLARLNGMPGRPPVTCVVLDNFMSFAQRVANEMGILAVVFCTMSACGFMGYVHYKELMDRGYFPLKDESCLVNGYLDTVLDWVPGMPGIRLRDMPSFIRTTDPDDFMVHFDSNEAQNARRAQGMIINTSDALEHDVVDALRRIFPRVYTIGPLLTFTGAMARPDAAAISGSLWKEDLSCLRWLDDREADSVVYVNFGSITVMTSAQLAEFAWGLARCGRPFLWVIRPDLVTGDKAMLPEDFYAETRDRGLFLSWCPQEQVLSHPSTGLFLTHSGWNSTLESIRAGVPMICWPFFAEQMTNCRYACTNWEIGLEIDSNVSREEVARLIKEAIDGEKGKDMKAKATMWKEKAVAATDGGGTSSVNIDRLVEFMLEGNVPTAARARPLPFRFPARQKEKIKTSSNHSTVSTPTRLRPPHPRDARLRRRYRVQGHRLSRPPSSSSPQHAPHLRRPEARVALCVRPTFPHPHGNGDYCSSSAPPHAGSPDPLDGTFFSDERPARGLSSTKSRHIGPGRHNFVQSSIG